MSQPLAGTAALVTGASSGIGAATARRLAAEGAAVGLVARRLDRLTELANEIKEGGGRTHVVQADVTDQQQAISAVEEVAEWLGGLDTVVNNAGVMLLGPALGTTTDEWDRMIALNVQGAAVRHPRGAAASGQRRRATRPGGWPTWSTSAPPPGGWRGPAAASTT